MAITERGGRGEIEKEKERKCHCLFLFSYSGQFRARKVCVDVIFFTPRSQLLKAILRNCSSIPCTL